MKTMYPNRCENRWIGRSDFGKWQWNLLPLHMNQKRTTRRYYSAYLGGLMQI